MRPLFSITVLVFSFLLFSGSQTFSQESLIDSLKLELETESNPDSALQLLRQLSSAYSDVDPVEERHYLEKVISLSKRIGPLPSLRNDYRNLAILHYYEGQNDSTFIYTDSVARYLEEFPDDSLKMINIMLQAVCYRSQGNYTEAIKQNRIALSLAQNLGYRNSERGIYNNLGNSYSNLGQDREALNHFFRALNTDSLSQSPRDKAVIYSNIGASFFDLKILDSSDYYLRKSLVEQGSAYSRLTALQLMGRMFSQTNQRDSAWEYLDLALEGALKFNQQKIEVLVLNEQGHLLLKERRFKECREKLNLAFQKSEELNLTAQLRDNLQYQYKLDSTVGNHKRAGESLSHFLRIKDELFNEELSNNVAFYQEKFNAEERELEISRLDQDKAENEAKLNRQKYIGSIIISGLLLALLLGVFILIIYFRALKSKKLLTAKTYA